MKIGMNMLLWTGHVTRDHADILRAIKATGFDGVEIPLFDVSEPDHYRDLAVLLDEIGLERTAVALVPDVDHSPISPDPTARARAVEHLRRVVACADILGAQVIAGPWFQPLGVFSGDPPTDAELDHCAEVHRQIVPLMQAAGIASGLEPLNRFEAYLLNTCEQAIAYANRLGEPGFGVLYDTFHANIEEKDPIAALRALAASGWLRHVHISENDRGTPGQGHAKIREAIAVLRELGYEGWMTIEAFGRALPELAAATRVWRDFFASPEEVFTQGHAYIRECWDAARPA